MAPAASASAMKGSSNGPLIARDESKYAASALIYGAILPMALRAVLELRIPDMLAKVEGRKPLSAEEILSQLVTKSAPGPTSISNLRRLLTPLVREGVFSESFNEKKEPLYGLTPISEWFVRDRELTLQPFAALHFCDAALGVWKHFHKVILDEDVIPFELEHGISAYGYLQQHPEFRTLVNESMACFSFSEVVEVVDTLQGSGVLEGVKTFVDVGGNQHALLVGRIVALNPHIKGINFDLPQVIEKSVEIQGVEHVGGSFFDSIPAGDLLCLKNIIHNYGDEDSTKILKACFKVLPEKGKVVLAEYLLSESHDRDPKSRFVGDLDLSMLSHFKGGRERTVEEYERILRAVGFSQVAVLASRQAVDLIYAIKE